MKKLAKLFIVLSITLFTQSVFAQVNSVYQLNLTKMNQLLRAVNDFYVDTVDFNKLVEEGTVAILKELDPHSTYIEPKEVERANAPLQGGFYGIGVAYQLIKDTINVVEVVVDGPSEKVGIRVGDKIVKVDTMLACGKNITNSWVQKHLRGAKGTKVSIWVKRSGTKDLLEFTVTRDKITQNSINVYFMVDNNTGYIRLERFAKDSKIEFENALTRLKARGLKNLILDLRGNSGGYLGTAFEIADEFISDKKMIVYTQSIRGNGDRFYSTEKGEFEKGKLIVLIDEGSASASEIVSGAVQDHDRGLIVGRRSFGKGLVQRPLNLVDKSEVRLTISRYYTPSGRCIQKPYNDGLESYFNDLNNRSRHGELFSADSIQFPDSLKFKTAKGRVVYGGGGIMPDIFIPLDTTRYSSLYNEMVRKGIISSFTMNFMEKNREHLKAVYPTIEDFKKGFKVDDDLMSQVMQYAYKEGVKDSVDLLFSARLQSFVKEKSNVLDSLYQNISDIEDLSQLQKMVDEYVKQSYEESMKVRNLAKVKDYLAELLMFEFARTLYSFGEAYQILLQSDETYLKAVDFMKEDKLFRKYMIDK